MIKLIRNSMLIQMMTKGKPSQIANLKTKIEELEKATEQMYRSQQVVNTLGNKVDEDMNNLLSESTLCEECHSQFTEKIEHICGRFDEAEDSSGLSEELLSDMDMIYAIYEDDEESADPVCGHSK